MTDGARPDWTPPLGTNERIRNRAIWAVAFFAASVLPAIVGMGALEVVKDKKTKEAFDLVADGAGLKVYNHAVQRGLFIRNMGDRIAICPPLIISEDELADLFGRLRQALDAAMAELRAEGHFKG